MNPCVRRRILLVASKTGYQVREFYDAAKRLDVDLVLATDRCHVLENPWGDDAVSLNFDAPLEEVETTALSARGPFDGILAVGDQPAFVAACVAERLGLRFHPSDGVSAANDKLRTRERFRAAGLNVPDFRLVSQAEGCPKFPCVLKPLHSSASRGVIRADTPAEFAAALARIHKIIGGAGLRPAIFGEETILVEDFIPGREFALEGIVSAAKLQTLAIFDKPDPLDGPFFEETIYVTPSRQAAEVQLAIREAAQQAVAALGLESGPVHAEMRVNDRGVWMLEAAARPIGGLCSRVLRFEWGRSPTCQRRPEACATNLEELLLQHALREDVTGARLAAGAHGVMMIPIPSAGIYLGVEGVEQALGTANIQGVEITAKEGQRLEPLPEGSSYLGFLFARAAEADRVEEALRRAHACLRFRIAPTLSVVR